MGMCRQNNKSRSSLRDFNLSYKCNDFAQKSQNIFIIQENKFDIIKFFTLTFDADSLEKSEEETVDCSLVNRFLFTFIMKNIFATCVEAT